MKPVFISYTTADKEKATEIRNLLEQEGFGCWMGNRDIPGGSNYTKEITNAIRECQVFLLILSAASQKSEYVFRELDFAVKQRKNVIPYMIEDQTLTDEFYFLLSSTNGIHAFEDNQTGQQKLLTRLKELIAAELNLFSKRPIRKSTRKIVVCPKCKSKRLKRSTSLWNECINNKTLYDRLTIHWNMWMPVILACIIEIVLLLLSKCSEIGNKMLEAYLTAMWNVMLPFKWIMGPYETAKELQQPLKLYIGSVLCSVWYFFFVLLFHIITGPIRNRVYEEIKHRQYLKGVDVYTFRCCQCYKKFRIKIPIREQNKYFVDDLVQDDKPEFTDKLINRILREK